MQKKPEFEAEFNRLKRFIAKDSLVLDIGAGMGRLAILLAKEVRMMTAIEPARVYMKIMGEKAARDGVGNMEFVEELWSDFPLQEKYDLVYSTWSPAVMNPASLMMMHKASRGYCALEFVASPPHVWDFSGRGLPHDCGRGVPVSGKLPERRHYALRPRHLCKSGYLAV
jgi:SAM-dependent methyltransferase